MTPNSKDNSRQASRVAFSLMAWAKGTTYAKELIRARRELQKKLEKVQDEADRQPEKLLRE